MRVGIDVGGTKAAAVLVTDEGVVLARSRRPTSRLAYTDLVSALADVVTDVLAAGAPGKAVQEVVEGVGIAVAGNVAADRSRVVVSPHLPLHGQPLPEDLQARLGVSVVLENDANAAAWAEYLASPLREVTDLFVLTVGTGLGAGLILAGRVRRGAHGFAGEPGHMPVVPDGRPCPCGGRGCWEQYASGTALVSDYRRRGGDVRLDGPGVTESAAAGDPLALASFSEIGNWLGFGLAGLVAVLDPAAIVIGGGVASAGDLLLAPTRLGLTHYLAWGGRRTAPPVHQASLGNEAGAIGAALLATVA